MDTFSEVYQKSVDIIKTMSLDEPWRTVQANLKTLLKQDGPDAAKASALDEMRAFLSELEKGKSGESFVKAEAMLAAAKVNTSGFQDRAAFLKTFLHFYLVQKKGNQSVWAMDPPRSLTAWPYDLFNGKTASGIKADLRSEDEVFGSEHRQMMSDALQLARKWSTDVQIKLSNAAPETLEIAKRWFHLPGDDGKAVQASASSLHAGFKKIVNACNSTDVTFCDLPHLRDDMNRNGTIAAVADGEKRPVIYLFKEFLSMGRKDKMGAIPKLWCCALTIVHELSHSLLKTEDIQYDYQGLNVRAGFSQSNAMRNADSWAHFAADVVHALPESSRRKALGQ